MGSEAGIAANDAMGRCFLGLDVGGSQTRWALATSSGELFEQGSAAGFSGVRLNDDAEISVVRDRLHAIADVVNGLQRGLRLCRVHAGVTGIGADAPQMIAVMARVFAVGANQVSVTSDAELVYRAVFEPGEGYLVYAGTGSIAAFVTEAGALLRAGGRGVMLDDAGGGYWIAREALRRIWRRDDEQPDAWHASPMAHELFARVGGESSIFSARFLIEQERGAVGMLALVVAAHAHHDALAAEILRDAGVELARLASAMTARYGKRKIVVTGRASQLHASIESAMRGALPADALIEFQQVHAHVAAARMAAEKYLVSDLQARP